MNRRASLAGVLVLALAACVPGGRTPARVPLDETPQAGGVRFTGWSIGEAGGAVIAANTWSATGDRVHESGTFTLTHAPR